MGDNKISDKLSKIINKEITQIELPIQTFTAEESEVSVSEKESDTNKIRKYKSKVSLPVEVDGYIPVIINFFNSAAMNSDEVKSILSNANISSEYKIIPAIAAKLSIEQISQLVQLSQVELIEFDDYVVATLDTARKWFGVDEAVKTYGLTGNEGRPNFFNKSDNVIAILDTGIDVNHVDLGSGKVIGWRDEINPATVIPYDDNGHGTHVSSIVAGLGKGIWDYRGVAYGSALVGVKVLNNIGFGTYSQIMNGIIWTILNKSVYNIKIINMSLGGGPSTGIRAAVTAAVASGIVVVCAAGNSGPGLGTIGSPGDAVAVITVGNMADVGQGGYFLVPSSSRGPTVAGLIKPDLVAPGFNITAAKAGSTNLYTTFTGTSMASPFVAGLVALMLDANKDLTPSQIKEILTATTQFWDGLSPNNDYGYGRLQAFDVVKKVCNMRGSKCKSNHCDNNDKCCDNNYSFCCSNYDYCCCDCWDYNCCKTDCHEEHCDKKEHDDHKALIQPSHFAVTSTIASPHTDDWYEFYVTEIGRPVGITLIDKSSGILSDPDLYVYDYNYHLIDDSISASRQDTISFVPNYLGKYLIRVNRFGSTAVSYSLDVSVFGKDFRLFDKK